MIRKAAEADRAFLAKLAAKLWGNHSEEELSAEISGLLLLTGAAFFLAEEDGQPVGFAQCQLQHDYVEGTDSSPAGYPPSTQFWGTVFPVSAKKAAYSALVTCVRLTYTVVPAPITGI